MRNINEPVPVREYCDVDMLTLEQLTASYQAFADTHGVPVENVKLTYEYDEGCYLTGLRPPTEKEIAKRKATAERYAARARKTREAKEAAERKELERLAKKYGTPVTSGT